MTVGGAMAPIAVEDGGCTRLRGAFNCIAFKATITQCIWALFILTVLVRAHPSGADAHTSSADADERVAFSA